MRHIAMDQKLNEIPHPAVANVQTDNPTPISLKGLWLQGAMNYVIGKLSQLKSIERFMKPYWKESTRWECGQHTREITLRFYLFARDANIGEAIRSPTINADDSMPSWKLFKLKSPLKETPLCKPNYTRLGSEKKIVRHKLQTRVLARYQYIRKTLYNHLCAKDETFSCAITITIPNYK